MRVRVVALGHRMPGWVSAAVADYAQRLPREWAFALVELRPEPRDRGRSIDALLAAEAARIATACAGYRIVALDERGIAWTTRQVATHLRQWRDAGEDVAFVIGSADGLAPQLKAKASAVLALSALTLPHGLVRVVVAEQLYRAYSLLTDHPYHRD
jgi:23S rRNA (pseudouridine1915-N3)-methyltransferase